MGKRWSKLQARLYNLMEPKVNFQIHCALYEMKSLGHYGNRLPRYFITVDKEIVFDYPKDASLNEKYIYLWNSDIDKISKLLLRIYVSTRNSKTFFLGIRRFFVSLLKHEAQHTVDMKQFPGITPPELEYRAKLVELHYANDLELLQKFLTEADGSKTSDSHAVAFARIKYEFADIEQRILLCIKTNFRGYKSYPFIIRCESRHNITNQKYGLRKVYFPEAFFDCNSILHWRMVVRNNDSRNLHGLL